MRVVEPAHHDIGAGPIDGVQSGSPPWHPSTPRATPPTDLPAGPIDGLQRPVLYADGILIAVSPVLPENPYWLILLTSGARTRSVSPEVLTTIQCGSSDEGSATTFSPFLWR